MIKLIKIICVNFIILIFVFILLEFVSYYVDIFQYKKDNIIPYGYTTFWNSNLNLDIYNLNDRICKSNNSNECSDYYFRLPAGINYNTNPILVFGCSYAYGSYLNTSQIFSSKLSDILKRPVYNMAMPGQGLSFMYYQVSHNNDFYKIVPALDTVFYIMISDHYRRMLLNKFSPLANKVIPHYNYDKRHNELKLEKYNLWFSFVNSSYLYSNLSSFYAIHSAKERKNIDKLNKHVVLYFIKTREILEKKWNKKIKFTIVLYDFHSDSLIKLLENNNFVVMSAKDLTNENLLSEKYYMKNNGHPTEEAWDLLTPLIIDKAKKSNSL